MGKKLLTIFFYFRTLMYEFYLGTVKSYICDICTYNRNEWILSQNHSKKPLKGDSDFCTKSARFYCFKELIFYNIL